MFSNLIGFWFNLRVNLCSLIFCNFNKGFRPKWTIYKRVSEKFLSDSENGSFVCGLIKRHLK